MKLYVVRNKEGKYFRNVGYGGSGRGCWVDTLDKARFYAKVGQAKSRCTFFANAYPKFGVPEILMFDLGSITPMVVSMDEHVSKAQKAKLIREAKFAVDTARRLRADAQRRYDVPADFRTRQRALLDLDEATERLEKAESNLADLQQKFS